MFVFCARCYIDGSIVLIVCVVCSCVCFFVVQVAVVVVFVLCVCVLWFVCYLLICFGLHDFRAFEYALLVRLFCWCLPCVCCLLYAAVCVFVFVCGRCHVCVYCWLLLGVLLFGCRGCVLVLFC